MTTFAPSRAARRPIAFPMPRLAPVMKRVLPFRSAMRADAMNDYASFHFAAFAIREGKNPYDPAVLAAFGNELGVGGVHPYFYPPLLAELLVPSSWLDPWLATIFFWIVSTAAIGYALWA